jgi:hypothetical protein
MKKNRDFTDVRTFREQVRAHKHRESDSLQDLIEENLVAEQELAALLRSRTPEEK